MACSEVALVCFAGSQRHNVTLHMHNDEARSDVNHGRAFGHFSFSFRGLRVAKLIEDMELTGVKCSQIQGQAVSFLQHLCFCLPQGAGHGPSRMCASMVLNVSDVAMICCNCLM